MRRLVWLGGAVLWAACGQENELGPRSGVAQDRLIRELGESDLKVLCRWLSDRELTRSVEDECTAFAVMDADTKQTCEQQRSACLAERATFPTERMAERQRCETAVLSKPRPNCLSTVGEVETCDLETLHERAAFSRKFSCDAPDEFGDLYPPDSCADVNLTCFPAGGLEDR